LLNSFWLNELNESLEKAVDSGHFMCVTFWVDEETKKLMLDRTSWEFSLVNFDACVELLRQNLREMIQLQHPEPLPLAPWLVERDRKEDELHDENI